MLKRFVSVMLVGCMVLLAMAGCAKKPEETNETANGGNESANGVEIVVWTGSEYANDEFGKESEERFKAKHPEITVKTVVHDGDRVADFITASAAGNAPDEVAISFPMLSKLVFNGLIAPIDEYWNQWEESQYFLPEVIENCKINGKLYGIPGETYLMGIVYNKRLFEEAGITKAPETWDELITVAKKLTDPAKQQVGFGLLTGQWVDWWFEYFVWQAGGDLTKQNEDGTVTCTFTDPAVIQAAEFYRKLKQEKVIQPDLTMDAATLNKNFAMGKIAMTIGTIGDTSAYTKLGMKKEDIGYTLFPKGPSGNNPSQFGGNLFGINASSPKEVQKAVFLHTAHQYCREEKIARWKYDEERGLASLKPSTRNDINQLDYQPSLLAEKDAWNVLNSALHNLRLEYYAKGSVGKYIDTAIQKILSDDSVDIKKELENAQIIAEKEGASDFNKAILGK